MTDGEIVYTPDTADGSHRCQLPFSTEQFSIGHQIPELDMFPVGTIWKCRCGGYWYVKRSDGYSTGSGRSWWLRWGEASKRRLRKAGIEI